MPEIPVQLIGQERANAVERILEKPEVNLLPVQAGISQLPDRAGRGPLRQRITTAFGQRLAIAINRTCQVDPAQAQG
jgi:hypothetical protein